MRRSSGDEGREVERLAEVVSKQLGGLAESGPLALVTESDLWDQVGLAAAGAAPDLSVVEAGQDIGRRWRSRGGGAAELATSFSGLRERLWALCALYASPDAAAIFQLVSRVDRWFDSLGSSALMAAVDRPLGHAEPSPRRQASGEARPIAISESEIDALITEVAELEKQRDRLRRESIREHLV